MHFRSVLGGTLALLLLSSVVAPASSTGEPADSGFSFHLPKLSLSGIFGERKKPDQQQVAQQSDGTTTPVLEEQLRQMNGKIEELNFQVLQMQEQIRKQQEDNEFRFQQLEGGSPGAPKPAGQKKSDAEPTTDSSVAEAPAQAPADAAAAPAGGQSIEDVIVESPTGDPGNLVTGTRPKTFGTITVDKNGNVIDADGNTQATAPAQNSAPATGAPGRKRQVRQVRGHSARGAPSYQRPRRTLPQFLPVHPLG